jgi:putative PIN family toxin of toxin-antitoxin system
VVITSQIILDKLDDVLRRQHIADVSTMDKTDIQDLQTLFQEEAILTPHALNLKVVKEDPEDDTIIIAAVEGNADCIISGDSHLKDLGTYQDIPILTPAQFVDQYHIPE